MNTSDSGQVTFEPHLFFQLLPSARQFSFSLDRSFGLATPRRNADRDGFRRALDQVRKEDKKVASSFEEQGRTLIGHVEKPSSAASSAVKISDYKPKLVASYSWNESSKSQIQTPGLFKRFKAPVCPPSGMRLNSAAQKVVDRSNLNTSLHGADKQLEPLFVAVLESHPQGFELDEFDFVTDRNNLRKMFEWIAEVDFRRFRIDFERFNKTILLHRFELPVSSSEMLIRDRTAICFEDKCTTGTNLDVSYRAIIKAKLGPHRILLRCEVDALDPPERPSKAGDEDDLASSIAEKMKSLALEENDRPQTWNYPGSALKFQRTSTQSEPVELDVQHFVELKSKKRQNWNRHKNEDMGQIWPQLFFSGTDRMIVGLRDEDAIVSVVKFSQSEVLSQSDFQDVQTVEQYLSMLSQMLTKLASMMKEEGSRYSLIFEPFENPTRRLTLYKRPTAGTVSAIPDWLRSYFTDPTQSKPEPVSSDSQKQN